MKLTKEILIDCWFDHIEQILENQEKAIQLETVSDKLGNELQVKVLEIEELKGEINDLVIELRDVEFSE